MELINLPEAPEFMSGLINLRGEIIPVMNIRKKFRLDQREMDLDDRIVIVRTSLWRTSFAVDSVQGVMEFAADHLSEADELFPEMDDYVKCVAKSDDDSVLIYDIDKLFSGRVVQQVNRQVENQKYGLKYFQRTFCRVK